MSQASFPIDTKRHSAAHLMAAAVKDIWPNARFGVGPATATGFFYDIALDETLTPDDLQTIEKRMKEMRKKKLPFERIDLPVEQAIDYMKAQLVEANSARLRAIEAGETVVVGVNKFTSTEPSPLVSADGGILVVDHGVEASQVEALKSWRETRDAAAVEAALAELKSAASEGRNIMPPSIAAAKAGVTTGEWSQLLRDVFGEYRAPTGVVATPTSATASDEVSAVRARVDGVSDTLGRRLKILVGKPGLDGHSNGAEQIAVKARDVGMEVVYDGIRLTPQEIVQSAQDEGVHVIGLSILSGSHGVLVTDVVDQLRDAGLGEIPVVVGGIIPEDDAKKLGAAGVSRVYTPKDFDLIRIMDEIIDVVSESNAA